MAAQENTSALSPANRQRLADAAYWLLLIGGCVVFLLMNLYTTIKEDDLFHSSVGSRALQPITGLMDVLRSWVDYYRFDPRTSNFLYPIFFIRSSVNGHLGFSTSCLL